MFWNCHNSRIPEFQNSRFFGAPSSRIPDFFGAPSSRIPDFFRHLVPELQILEFWNGASQKSGILELGVSKEYGIPELWNSGTGGL